MRKNKILIFLSLIFIFIVNIGSDTTNNNILYDMYVIKSTKKDSLGVLWLDSLHVSMKIKKYSSNGQEIKRMKKFYLHIRNMKNSDVIFGSDVMFSRNPNTHKNCYAGVEPFIYSDSCYVSGNKNNYLKFKIVNRKVSFSTKIQEKISAKTPLKIQFDMDFPDIYEHGSITRIF